MKRYIPVFLYFLLYFSLPSLPSYAEELLEIENHIAAESEPQMANSASAEGEIIQQGPSGDAIWTLYEDGTLIISGNGSMANYAHYNTSSGVHSPFYSLSDYIIRVIINEGITSIGSYSFYADKKIETIELPKSLISIGKGAFMIQSQANIKYYNLYYNGTLADWLGIEFASGGSNPCNYCSQVFFDGCEVSGEIVIPEGTDIIPNYAFQKMDHITSVIIPDSVTSIGSYAFHRCYGIISVSLSSQLNSIGLSAFEECGSLQICEIPECVRSIGERAFYLCSSLLTCKLPRDLTTQGLGKYAFSSCSSLTEVIILSSFLYCYSRRGISLLLKFRNSIYS